MNVLTINLMKALSVNTVYFVVVKKFFGQKSDVYIEYTIVRQQNSAKVTKNYSLHVPPSTPLSLRESNFMR